MRSIDSNTNSGAGVGAGLSIAFKDENGSGTTTLELEQQNDELAKMVTCSACGTEVAAAATCSACGAQLADELALELAAEVVAAAEDSVDEEVAEGTLPMWEAELAFEGMPTSDGRYLMPGGISERELPLSLMCQFQNEEGHTGSYICGKLTNIWRVDRPDLGDGVVAVMGSGEFSSDVPEGRMAANLIADEVLRGVSIDLAPTAKFLLDAETHEVVPEEEADIETYMNGGYLLGIEGELMGATVVPFAAFAGATMRIVGDQEDAEEANVVASAFGAGVQIPLALRLLPISITASAAGLAPLSPPKGWFFTPEPKGKCPLTVTDDGRIYGHLATWDQCHQGFLNDCVLAKPSRTGYAFFHVGQLKTHEGEMVDVGRVVVGDSGHANVAYTLQQADQHYDKTSCVGAFVRAVDGDYGIWLSGVVRSDCPVERVRDMIANPPSGDWRSHNGWLELIAALSVPVPGFPVPRYEYALTASANDYEVNTLVASGYYELEKPTLSRSEQRRREILLREAREVTA